MRVFNLILTLAALLMAALVVTNYVIGRSNSATAMKLEAAQNLSVQAGQNRAALDNLVNRVNQASAQDPALKTVLQKLQLTPAPANP